MKRISYFIYGVVSYAIFFATFLYAIGFIGNFYVPKTLDGAPEVPLFAAVLMNMLLLSVFAVQHSAMARPAFKKWWTRFVPQPVERSTYVLLSSLALIALFIFWQPMGGMIWDVQNEILRNAIYGMYGLGWIVVLVATFLINHFDLFGLRQVTLFLIGKPYTELNFKTPWLYSIVRHPLYVGWLLVFWATPTMSVTHLLFAAVTTVYILVAIQFEERDLMKMHPEYVDYRRRVPMLIPTGSKG